MLASFTSTDSESEFYAGGKHTRFITVEKCAKQDKDARWTKKHGKSHFGYKNHINVDRRHKLVRRYAVSSASVHDSQKLEDLLDPDNTASAFSTEVVPVFWTGC